MNELEMMNPELLEQTEMNAQNTETADTYAENLQQAEAAGNNDMAEYYRQKELQQLEQNNATTEKIKVDEKLNDSKEDSFGSSCATYCQKTATNSSLGNYSSYR